MALANYQGFDNIAVDIVQLNRKLALLAKDTRLRPLDRVFALRRRAAMSVDAFDILTGATMNTGSQASNKLQRVQLLFARLVGV
jgi:hypothetical protein